MKKVLSVFVAIVASVSLSSCFIDVKSVSGSGRITTENRNLSGFTKIDVEKAMNVTIEQGDTFEVIVEADDNVQSSVLTSVENGTLYISSDTNSFFDATMNVKIKAPVITEIETGSGATVTTKNTLLTENFSIKISSGSTAEIAVESDQIQAETSGGSTLTLRGKALTLETSSGGGSTIDAGNLLANDIKATSSSGSSTTVRPALSLKAKASSGSSINYKGDPKTVTVDESSGGSINKE